MKSKKHGHFRKWPASGLLGLTEGSCAMQGPVSSHAPWEIEMVAEVQTSGHDNGLCSEGQSEPTPEALRWMRKVAKTQRM